MLLARVGLLRLTPPHARGQRSAPVVVHRVPDTQRPQCVPLDHPLGELVRGDPCRPGASRTVTKSGSAVRAASISRAVTATPQPRRRRGPPRTPSQSRSPARAPGIATATCAAVAARSPAWSSHPVARDEALRGRGDPRGFGADEIEVRVHRWSPLRGVSAVGVRCTQCTVAERVKRLHFVGCRFSVQPAELATESRGHEQHSRAVTARGPPSLAAHYAHPMLDASLTTPRIGAVIVCLAGQRACMRVQSLDPCRAWCRRLHLESIGQRLARARASGLGRAGVAGTLGASYPQHDRDGRREGA